MKPRNKNELNGKMHAMKGAVKQTAGQIINDSNFNADEYPYEMSLSAKSRTSRASTKLERSQRLMAGDQKQ